MNEIKFFLDFYLGVNVDFQNSKMSMRADKAATLLSEMNTLTSNCADYDYFDLQTLLDSVGGKCQFYRLFNKNNVF